VEQGADVSGPIQALLGLFNILGALFYFVSCAQGLFGLN
jgi:hypothetical protein